MKEAISRQIADRLGIQSYCFRQFKDAGMLIEKVRECGLAKLELYSGHCDAAGNDAAGFVSRLRDAGITMDAWFNGIPSDTDGAERVFKNTKEAGCRVIVVGEPPPNMPQVAALCRKYGMKIAVHNHGRKHACGSVAALNHIFSQFGPEIGLCLDTAWMLDSGENPVTVAERFIDRLYGVHIKDFVFNRAGRPEDVVVGAGNLDLAALIGVLEKHNFQGALTLEYEGDPGNPVPALRECIAAINHRFGDQA